MHLRLLTPLILFLASWCFLPSVAHGIVRNPGVYTYLSLSDPDSLDPAWSYDSVSHLAIASIYETLFEVDADAPGGVKALLAAKIPTRENQLISPDGKTYTIPIRPGVRFHDGTALTAEDARYSILRFMLQDRDAGPSSLLLEPLLGRLSTRDEKGAIVSGVWEEANKSVSVESGALVLRLPRPYAPLLSILSSWAPVVSRDWARRNGDWDGTEAAWARYNNPQKQSSPFFERANGSAPFKLARWDRKTKELLLARHEEYWRKPARLSKVVIRAIKEFSTRRLMLMAGDADNIAADRPALSQLQDAPGLRVVDGLSALERKPMLFFGFSLNPSANRYIGSGRLDGDGVPPDFFADKNLRRAFAHAIDYEGYIKDVFRGQGRRAGGCVPPGLDGHDPAAAGHASDLSRAGEFFRKAHGGRVWEKGFRLTLSYSAANSSDQTLAQMIKRRVESLNPRFRIDLMGLDWPAFLDASTAGKLPLYIMGWTADYPDAHNFAFPLLHSKGSYPVAQRWRHAEMDRLVEAALAETRPAPRRALYQRLQALEIEELPHIVVLDKRVFRVQRDWVRGWRHDPLLPDAPHGSRFYDLDKTE